MRKTLYLVSIICLFVILFSSETFGQSVSYQMVEKVAGHKINSLEKTGQYSVVPVFKTFRGDTGNLLFYLVELDPTGYLVISPDECLPPVIAYSFQNKFPVSQNNVLVNLIKRDLAKRKQNIALMDKDTRARNIMLWNEIQNASSLGNKTFEQWPPPGTTTTGGWLETNWSQSSPYNNFCPMDPVTNQRSIAGCPSVALAMIINYYETINGTVFTDPEDDYYHSYAGRNYWIDDDHETIDFISFPEINGYFDTISNSYASQSPLKEAEKAALVFACGVAAQQVYTSSISGTFGVDQAYDAFLRFGFADAILLNPIDTSIHTHLAQNMMDARPSLLAVIDPGVAGHNLVVDGYNTDNFYHLNFGWGGSYNNWYKIPDEIPYNLTVFEGVIVDVAYPPVVSGNRESAIRDFNCNIFPNPVTDFLHVQLDISQSGSFSLELFDVNGDIIYDSYKTEFSAGRHNLTFSLKEVISPGLYFCRISYGELTTTEKIIVQ